MSRRAFLAMSLGFLGFVGTIRLAILSAPRPEMFSRPEDIDDYFGDGMYPYQ